MKKSIFLIMLFINIIAYSQTFNYNGINYSKINSNIVKVDVNSTSLSGEIPIPDSVSKIDNITKKIIKL